MGRGRLRTPATLPQGEREIKARHTEFFGMIDGPPASELPPEYSQRNININDHRQWAGVRSGTRLYTSTSMPAGDVQGTPLDHRGQDKLVWHIGSAVYWTNKAIDAFVEVINTSDSTPTGESKILAFGDDAIILTSSGIFRVHLDADTIYMRQINMPIPSDIVTDVSEDIDAGLVYGYHYIYALSFLGGSGNRDRTDAELVYETGTSQADGSTKDYGEVFFSDPVGVYEGGVFIEFISSGYTVPDGVGGVSHFSVYRTKNIGRNSGGIDAQNGVGNLEGLFAWVDDIPVAKAFKVTSDGPGTELTPASGVNAFEYSDVGNTVTDTGGNVAIIQDLNGANAIVSAGLSGSSTLYLSLGGGRLQQASQSGTTVTRTAGQTFQASDVGDYYIRDDGKFLLITGYTDADTVTVGESDTWSGAGTLRPTTGNFSRKFNDIFPDDAVGVDLAAFTYLSDQGMQQRIAAASPLYFPRRFFEPLPDSNTGGISSGFLIVAERDDTQYYYSQYGDKQYNLGHYLPVIQEIEISDKIRDIIEFPSIIAIACPRSMIPIPLNVYLDVGSGLAGESVFKLNPPPQSDINIGVYHWKSIAHKGESLIYAVTTEPRVRAFDGYKWSSASFETDQRTGLESVAKFLRLIDSSYEVIGVYEEGAGYILWFYNRESVIAAIIQDTGGDAFSPIEDIWQDTGGDAFSPGEDIIQNQGGVYVT